MKAVCYGAGVIGASWATTFSLNGCETALFDPDGSILKKAEKQIADNLDYLVETECITAGAAEEAKKRCFYTGSPEEALDRAEFVQESGPEVLNIKQEIVQMIDRCAPAGCVVASSTSGLKITDITAKSENAERYVGAHPFNPPHLLPLVELTLGEKTQQKYLDKALAFYRSMKKEPVVLKKEKAGFIANRLSHAVLREVVNLVDEGACSVEDADKALVYGLGLRWASIGQMMIGELGTPGGTGEMIKKFGPLNERIFSDLENRTKLPEDWEKQAVEGVEEERSHMPEYIGKTNEEISRFRDTVMIELLKIHHKI